MHDRILLTIKKNEILPKDDTGKSLSSEISRTQKEILPVYSHVESRFTCVHMCERQTNGEAEVVRFKGVTMREQGEIVKGDKVGRVRQGACDVKTDWGWGSPQGGGRVPARGGKWEA